MVQMSKSRDIASSAVKNTEGSQLYVNFLMILTSD